MSSVIRRFFTLGCASSSGDALDHQRRHRGKIPKIRFGVPLVQVYKDNELPWPLIELIAYVAKEGVTAPAVFRRPGNKKDVSKIGKRMQEGKFVPWTSFNFYTLSSVIKKFLLELPGGLFGPDLEQELLTTLKYDHPLRRYDVVNETMNKLPKPTQQLVALLFGTWFRIANHAEFHGMSAESIAKSVTGSLFHSVVLDPVKVENAAKLVEFLIENYGVANMFGQHNIQYFVDVSNTRIQVTERFKYEYHFPPTNLVPREQALRAFTIILQNEAKKQGFDLTKNEVTPGQFFGPSDGCGDRAEVTVNVGSHVAHSDPVNARSLKKTSSISAPEVNANKKRDDLRNRLNTTEPRAYKSMTRFDTVKLMQLQRMRKRSDWFLSSSRHASSLPSDSFDRSSRGTSLDKTMSEAGSDVGSEIGSVFDEPDRSCTPSSEPAFFEKSPSMRAKVGGRPRGTSAPSAVHVKYYMVERCYNPQASDTMSQKKPEEGATSSQAQQLQPVTTKLADQPTQPAGADTADSAEPPLRRHESTV